VQPIARDDVRGAVVVASGRASKHVPLGLERAHTPTSRSAKIRPGRLLNNRRQTMLPWSDLGAVKAAMHLSVHRERWRTVPPLAVQATQPTRAG